jgi:hypothetical protein
MNNFNDIDRDANFDFRQPLK